MPLVAHIVYCLGMRLHPWNFPMQLKNCETIKPGLDFEFIKWSYFVLGLLHMMGSLCDTMPQTRLCTHLTPVVMPSHVYVP